MVLSTAVNTLYFKNFPGKTTVKEMKVQVRSLCEAFGTVSEVKVGKGKRLQRQCFVVFDRACDTTEALRKLNGFPFHEVPLEISRGKGQRKKETRKRAKERTFYFQVPSLDLTDPLGIKPKNNFKNS